MRLFNSTKQDERKLTQPWYEIARQSSGRRQFVHGKIHASWCVCKACTPREIAA